jgi:hypothetical protein
MPSYIDEATKRMRYEALRSELWRERATFDAHWQELADYMMPRRTRFWAGDRNRGDKRNQKIIDSTGRFAARTLASGLHAGLTSPARPWMKLTTPDPDLAEFGPVREWLHVVTLRMLTIFATSNLYNVLPLAYLDLGIFGTSAMSMMQDNRDLFRAFSYPTGSFALGMDHRGMVTTFVRDYELTVRQVVEEFGVQENGRTIDWSNISATVKDLWDHGNYEQAIEVTWIVKPNEHANANRVQSKYLPWISCHFETGSRSMLSSNTSLDQRKFLRESGYRTFPLMCPRWDITGEDSYGTDCPGMTALPDVKQLQLMQKKKGQLISKAVDPPLVGPSTLRTQKTSLLAGDITYNDSRDGMAGLRPIHEVRLEGFQHLTADMREVQYRIQRAFYEDLFLMIASSDERLGAQRPTAREIDERHEEKLLALGPVLERTNDELLDPIVDRAFDLMETNGLLPPPPEELHGVKLKVEYISILATAQKLVGVAAQDRFLQSVGAMVEQGFTDVMHKVNSFRTVDNYADMLGVDPRMVRSDEEAQADVDSVRQQQAAAQAAETAKNFGQAAAAGAKAPLTGDTALARIVNSASGIPAASVP